MWKEWHENMRILIYIICNWKVLISLVWYGQAQKIKKALFPRAPLIFEEMELSSSKIKKSAKVLQNIGPRNIEWQLKSLMPNRGVIK